MTAIHKRKLLEDNLLTDAELVGAAGSTNN